MVRIQTVKPLEDFKVYLEFTDGTQKVVDLEPFLHGPVFEPLKDDVQLFRAVQVDKQLGTIVWDNAYGIMVQILTLTFSITILCQRGWNRKARKTR
jgi:hypothetical protein